MDSGVDIRASQIPRTNDSIWWSPCLSLTRRVEGEDETNIQSRGSRHQPITGTWSLKCLGKQSQFLWVLQQMIFPWHKSYPQYAESLHRNYLIVSLRVTHFLETSYPEVHNARRHLIVSQMTQGADKRIRTTSMTNLQSASWYTAV